MGKIRVPLFNQPRNFRDIDPEATAGAIIGTNVYNQDGSLYVPASEASSNTTIINGKTYTHKKEAGSTYAISAIDDMKIIEFTFAGAITVTMSGLIPFSSGFDCVVFCTGTGGQVTFSGTNGMAIVSSDSMKTRTQYSPVGLMVDETNQATLYGDIEPVALAGSVLARVAGSSGAPAWLQAVTNGHVLRRLAGVLGFGTLPASEVPFTPAGTISATNVQAALAELDSEKQPANARLTEISALVMSGNALKAVRVNAAGDGLELGSSSVDLTAVTTDVKLTVEGKGFFITEGSNAKMGVATLVAGTVTVNTTAVGADSRIFYSIQSLGTVSAPKAIAVTAKTAGASFTITSADVTDTSVVAWLIVDALGVPAASDPYLGSVVALLSFDGVDGYRGFTDMTGKTWYPAGDAQIDTAQKKYGTAAGLFDGTGDHMVSAHNSELNLSSGDFTIEGWFRLNATPSANMYLIDKDGTSGSTYASYAMYVTTAGKLVGYVADGSAATVPTVFTGTTTITTGQWYHFAMTRSGSTVRIFLDGNQEASGTGSTMVDGSKPLYIGWSNLQGAGTLWNGWIDGVRVTKGVARYTAAFTPPTSAYANDGYDANFAYVSALLHFNGTNASTSFIDVVGNTWTAVGDAKISTAQSKFGGSSAMFDGSGDYIYCTDAGVALGTGDFTIEAFIYRTATGTYNIISWGGNNAIYMNSGSDNLYVQSGGTLVITSAGVASGNWFHVALCRQAGVFKFYVDGVLDAEQPTVSTNFSTADLRIGERSGSSNRFNGYVDEFRVTKGLARYTSAFTPPTAPFANVGSDASFASVSALLPFNGQNASTSIIDVTGNAWTVTGNAKISTAQSKFDGSSAIFDGAGDIISSTSTSVINLANDFTVEYWVYQVSNGATLRCHTHFYNSSGSNNGLNIYRRSSDGAVMVDNGLTGTTAGTIVIPLNTWTHIAVVRNSGTIRAYVNGVQALSHAAQSYPATVNLSSIGMFKGALYDMDGHIDDWRVTNGVCRYPSGTTFTPPSRPHPVTAGS